MTITVPVAVPPAALPLPAPEDRATFTARKLEQLRWANEDLAPGVLDLAQAAYDNALDAQGSATAAAASAVSAAASNAAAAATTNVVKWISGTSYGEGVTTWSTITYLTYRRTSSSPGASTTDPSLDPTRWASLAPVRGWIRKTSAYTAMSGERIKASTAAAAWPLTLPLTPSDGDEVEVQDVDGNFDLNNLTVLGNGKKVMGYTTSWVLNTACLHVVLVYDATLGDWRI